MRIACSLRSRWLAPFTLLLAVGLSDGGGSALRAQDGGAGRSRVPYPPPLEIGNDRFNPKAGFWGAPWGATRREVIHVLGYPDVIERLSDGSERLLYQKANPKRKRQNLELLIAPTYGLIQGTTYTLLSKGTKACMTYFSTLLAFVDSTGGAVVREAQDDWTTFTPEQEATRQEEFCRAIQQGRAHETILQSTPDNRGVVTAISPERVQQTWMTPTYLRWRAATRKAYPDLHVVATSKLDTRHYDNVMKVVQMPTSPPGSLRFRGLPFGASYSEVVATFGPPTSIEQDIPGRYHVFYDWTSQPAREELDLTMDDTYGLAMAEAYTWFKADEPERRCFAVWERAHADTVGVTALVQDGHAYVAGGTVTSLDKALAIAGAIKQRIEGAAPSDPNVSLADACAAVERRNLNAVLVENYHDRVTGAMLYYQTMEGMGVGTGLVITVARSPYFAQLDKDKRGYSLGDLIRKINAMRGKP